MASYEKDLSVENGNIWATRLVYSLKHIVGPILQHSLNEEEKSDVRNA